jgi:hypothetical protein
MGMDPGRHHRRHHLSRAQRKAVRVVQILAILLCAAAITDFSYMAYRTSDCFTGSPGSDVSGPTPRVAVNSSECQVEIARRDRHMRFDGLAVLLAIALFGGAGVALSRARPSTKRLVLGSEAVALVLILVYSLLWIFSWH